MDTKKLDPIDEAKACIDKKKSFVLHGGAGSGKTESLKDLLEFMQTEKPEAKVICITHTNVAVNELKERIGNTYQVSTIHSFFYNLIVNYKKNIKSVIHELYTLPLISKAINSENISDDEQQKTGHKEYKTLYNKYADMLYSMQNEICKKVVGKREYDKMPAEYNKQLNLKIKGLNDKIIDSINNKDHADIKYNQTKFNNLDEVSFGHDGLLDIVKLLFDNYPIFKKIISDKYDYVFIDEYQDTRSNIIENFISIAEKNSNFTLCLFGDSMQAIYNDGIGSLETYINNGTLISIQKVNNYRCSYEVLDLINTLRLDGVTQEVALAKNRDGQIESEASRHGEVNIYYSIYHNKPRPRSTLEEKEDYLLTVETLIDKTKGCTPNTKTLLLTNKAIAEKEGFLDLYKVFNDRYSVEITDHIDEFLSRSGIIDLCEIYYNYIVKNYNNVILQIKKSGYHITKIADKIELKQSFDSFIEADYSLLGAINFANEKKIFEIPKSLSTMKKNNERFLKELEQNPNYQVFKKNYTNGKNTYTRMKEVMSIESEGKFKDLERNYKKERFINTIFSENTKFSEAINYYKYINETSDNITMHKTKGSSIDSVVVVMEEFFWGSAYNFSSLYSDKTLNPKIKENSQKLIYVACSRARKNLTCIRLIEPDEEKSFCEKFPNAKKITL